MRQAGCPVSPGRPLAAGGSSVTVHAVPTGMSGVVAVAPAAMSNG